MVHKVKRLLEAIVVRNPTLGTVSTKYWSLSCDLSTLSTCTCADVHSLEMGMRILHLQCL